MRDDEIVALYWERNEDAISQTAQKYAAYLSKIALNILSDTQDSEECVNDTYLRAWNSMPTNRPSILSLYLGKITRSAAIDRYRKKHTNRNRVSEFTLSLAELGDSFSDGTTPEEELHAEALQDALNLFLHRLPNPARTMFIGRYYFFDSVKEIARYCGVAEGTVKSSLHRSRQALREYLVKEGFEI